MTNLFCCITGAYDHNIYVYEASTGFQHWKYTTGDQVKDSACVNPVSGLIYVGSHDHNVYCIDIQVRAKVLNNNNIYNDYF